MTMTLAYDTLDLHYTVSGSGADVLLIHGWASSGRMWDRLANDLADRARFWSVDLCGFGASPHPPGDFPLDVEFHVESLARFCQQHDIRPRIVMGHSMGGMLALKLALTHPNLMESLVLMSPVVTGRFGYRVDLNRVITSDVGRFALARSKPFWMLAQNMLPSLLSVPPYVDEEVAQRISYDFKRTSWQGAIYGIESLARENLHPHLPRISHPSLVIIGDRDTTVSPEEGRLAAQTIPGAALLELPDIHHQPLDEAPERVVAAVADRLIH